MSWGPLLVNLAVTAGLVAVLMLATFGYAMRTRVHAIMDTIWPLGFVLIAVVTFGLSAGSGVAGRRVLVLVLTAVWGLRLGAHIYNAQPRAGRGHAVRLAAAAQPREPGGVRAALHLLDAGPGHVVRVAAGAGSDVRARAAGPGFVAGCGGVGGGVRLRGGRGRAAARRFLGRPGQRRAGARPRLWRYTRHPNDFGDATVWFGLWLLACSHWLGLVLVASPVYMTNMLVRHTGKRLLEKHMARSKGAAYADYVQRTGGFIPRPPR